MLPIRSLCFHLPLKFFYLTSSSPFTTLFFLSLPQKSLILRLPVTSADSSDCLKGTMARR
uniref:Uncharacterized protein n=1 Tax=Kalanchoe fedtschenkoi TaxID=63787 RepID=A0A7N0UC08_KALFE